MGAYVFSSEKNTRRKGFAMAEAVAALFIVCFAIALVAGLATQVTNLGKSTRQTAAVVELRNKNNAITRNTDDWMSKMRSSVATNGIYAACLPHNGVSSSIYKCPAPNNSILDRDAELKRIAGTQLHVVSAPIVDMLGDTLAGAEDAPLYLDLDGRPCTDATAATRCPLKSTGYFFRTNPLTNANPGDVRFVVKVERNALAVQSTANTTPVKTQYLSIDVGSQWLNVGGFCPSGTLLLGYLNGSPYCVNPAQSCAAGKISLGLDSAGAPICQTPPTCDKSGIALDNKTNTLVCSLNTPCENSQIFLGYFSGTGTPMCSSTTLSCSSGSVQVGMKEISGKLEASCEKLPSCKDSEKIAYDGTKFQCQNASLASTCLAGEVVVGINTDGSAKCEASEISSNDLTCPDGQVMYGLNKDGSVKCRDEVTRDLASVTGASGASGAAGTSSQQSWEDVPLSSTTDFDSKCMYHIQLRTSDQTNQNLMNGNTSWRLALFKSNKFLGFMLTAQGVWGIPSSGKNTYGYRDTNGVYTVAGSVTILKIEKSCENSSLAQSTTSGPKTCPSGFSLIGSSSDSSSFCFSTASETPSTYAAAVENCYKKNAQLCSNTEWYTACRANEEGKASLQGMGGNTHEMTSVGSYHYYVVAMGSGGGNTWQGYFTSASRCETKGYMLDARNNNSYRCCSK